jgi:hypothetical protein
MCNPCNISSFNYVLSLVKDFKNSNVRKNYFPQLAVIFNFYDLHSEFALSEETINSFCLSLNNSKTNNAFVFRCSLKEGYGVDEIFSFFNYLYASVKVKKLEKKLLSLKNEESLLFNFTKNYVDKLSLNSYIIFENSNKYSADENNMLENSKLKINNNKNKNKNEDSDRVMDECLSFSFLNLGAAAGVEERDIVEREEHPENKLKIQNLSSYILEEERYNNNNILEKDSSNTLYSTSEIDVGENDGDIWEYFIEKQDEIKESIENSNSLSNFLGNYNNELNNSITEDMPKVQEILEENEETIRVNNEQSLPNHCLDFGKDSNLSKNETEVLIFIY